MSSQAAYLQTWPLVQVLAAIGFNLDGWKVALVGDDAGEGQAVVRLRYALSRPQNLPADTLAGLPGTAPADHDLIIHLGMRDPAEAARTSAALLPHCRWLVVTLPDAPGHWEALDHLPIAHRFAFPEFDTAAVKWAAQDVAQSLRFGYLLRGEREPAGIPLRPAAELLLPAKLQPALAESGMRLLFVAGASWARMLAGEYFDPDHIKVLHPKTAARCDEGCDAHFEPGRESFAAACERLPPGWTPDAVIVVTPEYTGIPADLEDCPWPTVALISDWNVNIRDLAPCLGAFDLVLGDSSGMQRLRALGFTRVHYWPMYSYDTALHRPADVPKLHDLAFIGNLNHRVQRQRTRWLRHVADMSDACKVMIGVGLFGADYARVLQASRLVFNRSIRGELNLRCYEATACGALLLVEDTNDEARSLFRAGVDCVYYNDANVDDLVARFLENPAELNRVAASGTARALASSYTAHFSGLLALLGDLRAAQPRPRSFATLSQVERLLRLGRLAYRRTQAGRLPFAQTMLSRARDLAPEARAIVADLAVVYASIADDCAAQEATASATPGTAPTQEAAARDGSGANAADNPADNPDTARAIFAQDAVAAAAMARDLFELALSAAPDHPVTGLNAAWFYRKRDPRRARELLLRVAETDSGPCTGLLYPMSFRHLEVEMETAWHTLLGRPGEQETELRRLLTWQAAQWLGDCAWGRSEWPGDGEPAIDDAIHWYQVACGLRPDLAETQIKLGEALLHSGDFRNAEARFAAALEDNSLSVTAMKGLVRALAGRGATGLATSFYDECLAILPAIPQLLDQLDDLRDTYWNAIGSAPETQDDADRLTLEGLRDRNYLLFAEGPAETWLPGLQAYLSAETAAEPSAPLAVEPATEPSTEPGTEPACLVVYSADRTPDHVLGEIQGYLERSGLDPEAIPDILVVDRPLTERQEHELVTLTLGVHASLPERRRALVSQVRRPLLEHFGSAAEEDPLYPA